jgi:tetratricopeptide (TPR) repeat protein
MTLVSFSLVVVLYRGEVNTFNSNGNYNLNDQSIKSMYKDMQTKVIQSKLIDPTYSLASAMHLIQSGFTDEGLAIVKQLHSDDPLNLDAINGLALTSEQLNKISDAIIYREKIAKLDPWNAVNYLALGKDYKAQGDLSKSRVMLDKILSFSTGDIGGPIAEQAKTELAS